MRRIEADLVYIDPPYNSRQYCDAYHLLENVARWEKPKVYGVARKMDRTALKSDYCTARAAEAFEDLVKHIHAKYILLSYNNMARKGNERSNAKISDEDILRILEKKGEVHVYSESYKAFTTGKSDIKENEERLFLCKCRDYHKEPVPSPLNYTGGKFKLLPQLLPLFPQDMDQMVDLFCGGCNVGINAAARRVVYFERGGETEDTLYSVYGEGDPLQPGEEIFIFLNEYGIGYGSQGIFRVDENAAVSVLNSSMPSGFPVDTEKLRTTIPAEQLEKLIFDNLKMMIDVIVYCS